MPSYIVTFSDSASPKVVQETIDEAQRKGGKILHKYNIINAFSVSFPDGEADGQMYVNALTGLEHIKDIEQDQGMQAL